MKVLIVILVLISLVLVAVSNRSDISDVFVEYTYTAELHSSRSSIDRKIDQMVAEEESVKNESSWVHFIITLLYTLVGITVVVAVIKGKGVVGYLSAFLAVDIVYVWLYLVSDVNGYSTFLLILSVVALLVEVIKPFVFAPRETNGRVTVTEKISAENFVSIIIAMIFLVTLLFMPTPIGFGLFFIQIFGDGFLAPYLYNMLQGRTVRGSLDGD